MSETGSPCSMLQSSRVNAPESDVGLIESSGCAFENEANLSLGGGAKGGKRKNGGGRGKKVVHKTELERLLEQERCQHLGKVFKDKGVETVEHFGRKEFEQLGLSKRLSSKLAKGLQQMNKNKAKQQAVEPTPPQKTSTETPKKAPDAPKKPAENKKKNRKKKEEIVAEGKDGDEAAPALNELIMKELGKKPKPYMAVHKLEKVLNPQLTDKLRAELTRQGGLKKFCLKSDCLFLKNDLVSLHYRVHKKEEARKTEEKEQFGNPVEDILKTLSGLKVCHLSFISKSLSWPEKFEKKHGDLGTFLGTQKAVFSVNKSGFVSAVEQSTKQVQTGNKSSSPQRGGREAATRKHFPILVRNVPCSTNRASVERYFAQFGKVTEVNWTNNRDRVDSSRSYQSSDGSPSLRSCTVTFTGGVPNISTNSQYVLDGQVLSIKTLFTNSAQPKKPIIHEEVPRAAVKNIPTPEMILCVSGLNNMRNKTDVIAAFKASGAYGMTKARKLDKVSFFFAKRLLAEKAVSDLKTVNGAPVEITIAERQTGVPSIVFPGVSNQAVQVMVKKQRPTAPKSPPESPKQQVKPPPAKETAAIDVPTKMVVVQNRAGGISLLKRAPSGSVGSLSSNENNMREATPEAVMALFQSNSTAEETPIDGDECSPGPSPATSPVRPIVVEHVACWGDDEDESTAPNVTRAPSPPLVKKVVSSPPVSQVEKTVDIPRQPAPAKPPVPMGSWGPMKTCPNKLLATGGNGNGMVQLSRGPVLTTLRPRKASF